MSGNIKGYGVPHAHLLYFCYMPLLFPRYLLLLPHEPMPPEVTAVSAEPIRVRSIRPPARQACPPPLRPEPRRLRLPSPADDYTGGQST